MRSTIAGLIDAANAQLGGADYEKHFTEMLRTKLLQDIKLGDGGNDSSKVDTYILSGSRANYAVERVTFTDHAGQSHNVVRITDTRPGSPDGSDLVADIEKFQFGSGNNAATIGFSELVNGPPISVSDASITEGDAGSVNVQFVVSIPYVVPYAVSASYATANGSATAPVDFVSAMGTVTIPAGQTSVSISIATSGDILDEVDENFSLVLSNPANGSISDGVGLATILDNDPLPGISISDASIAEGDAGTAILTYTVSLSAPSSKAISVNYASADGSADGSDYTAASGVLNFAPGETSHTVSLIVSGDTLHELNETANITLSAPVNAAIADGSGVGTITNDDAAPVLSIGTPVAVIEGGVAVMQFSVTLSAVSALPVSFAYATADGSAIAGSDYTAASGAITIPAGQLSETISVPILNDNVFELTESFSVGLSGISGATAGTVSATGTINNDDAVPAINVTDQTVFEGNNGSSFMIFTVTLANASDQTVSVNYATIDNTATGGSDFGSQSGLLTFAPGQTSRTVAVPINGDVTFEDTENFTLSLTNAVNSTLGTTGATGTITNDDAAPTLVDFSSIGNRRRQREQSMRR